MRISAASGKTDSGWFCAGWFLMQSSTNRTIKGGQTVQLAGACIINYEGSRYLPADLSSHLSTVAHCTAGPAAGARAQLQTDLQTELLAQNGYPPLPGGASFTTFDSLDNRLSGSPDIDQILHLTAKPPSAVSTDDASKDKAITKAGFWLTVAGTVGLVVVAVAIIALLASMRAHPQVLIFLYMELVCQCDWSVNQRSAGPDRTLEAHYSTHRNEHAE